MVRADRAAPRIASTGEKAAASRAASNRAAATSALIAFARAVTAWERAGSPDGHRPVDPRQRAHLGATSPWRKQKACMDASHWTTEMRVGAAVAK